MRYLTLTLCGLLLLGWTGAVLAQAAPTASVPGLSISMGGGGEGTQMANAIRIGLLMTILSVLPALLISVTSFTRTIIVLSFLRQALGVPQIPPNQVLVGLSLFLSMFVMGPVIDDINTNAYKPFMEQKISMEEAGTQAVKPLRTFMLKFTREKDLALFISMAGAQRPATPDDIPLRSLVPAFMISELKTSFQIGFMIYIPFLVVDLVVSSILLAMGMMVLPPMLIAMPLKLMLFVLIDGWNLILDALVRSFR